jgi:hypothetical protein
MQWLKWLVISKEEARSIWREFIRERKGILLGKAGELGATMFQQWVEMKKWCAQLHKEPRSKRPANRSDGSIAQPATIGGLTIPSVRSTLVPL